MNLLKTYLAIGSILIVQTSSAQNTFYDLSTIQQVELFFSDPEWDFKLDTLKAGSDGYLMADSVLINGQVFDSVGVKYKGNSSYDATYIKNPFHISLDEFINQGYQGVSSVKLGNGYADPSLIREVLAYTILGNYMHCPRANFAKLYINGAYIGVYSNEESIDKDFCSEHFFSSQNTLLKCNPILNPGPTTKSNLKYISADSSAYFNYYEVKSTNGWNDLVALCDTVSNSPSSLEAIVDIDRMIWMLAFNNVLVNLDSYSGVFAQNYYLYKDHTGHFNPVIWDLNMCFGGFPFVGSGNSSMGSLTTANMQQLPVVIHGTDVYWPLIKAIMANPMYKRMYVAHMRTITSEVIGNNYYSELAAQMQTQIDVAVTDDANKFYSYSDFQNAMTTSVNIGNYAVPGIAELLDARSSFLQSTTEFGYSAPSISSVLSSNVQPALGASFEIISTVSNATVVYLGYRFDVTQKFERIPMYDDGSNGDGLAGDGVYGTSLSMIGNQLQYYVYAENGNAGMFSPVRAEYEYYTLLAGFQLATMGQIVVNEFLAVNQNGAIDEAGQHEDWIELYNATDQIVSLNGLYLSDDANNLQKYAFDSNVSIAPHGFTIVWADEDLSGTSLHANFKLAAAGEGIYLSDVNGNIFENIIFDAQTADVSMARCPNATGPFLASTPTFAMLNCDVINVPEVEVQKRLVIFPNPTSGKVVLSNSYYSVQLEISDIYGNVVLRVQPLDGTIDLTNLSSGVYLISDGMNKEKFLVFH